MYAHKPQNDDIPRALILTGLVCLGLVYLFGWLNQLRPDPAPPAPVPAPAPIVQPETPVPPVTAEDFENAPVQRFMGYQAQPRETERFLKTMPKPTLPEAAPELIRRSSDDTPVLLYRALYEAYAWRYPGSEWIVGAQGIGDCVSWGWAHGCDIHLAVMFKLGSTSVWKPAATEAIYGGSRVEANGGRHAGYGDGSYGGAAAKFVRDFGVVFREPYAELNLDLSKYSSSRAKDWGNFGCGGRDDNGRLDTIAKKHPVRNVALVSTFAEAAAAISSGYPVPVCSGRGFSYQRDSEGFCRPSGSWSHCMCFIGVRYDRPGLLCLNSWGPKAFTGPKWPEDQPEGSFWVDADVAEGMLRGRDSFAVSGYEGFPYRDLKHGDWVETRPQQVRELMLAHKLFHDDANRSPAEGVYVLAP